LANLGFLGKLRTSGALDDRQRKKQSNSNAEIFKYSMGNLPFREAKQKDRTLKKNSGGEKEKGRSLYKVKGGRTRKLCGTTGQGNFLI